MGRGIDASIKRGPLRFLRHQSGLHCVPSRPMWPKMHRTTDCTGKETNPPFKACAHVCLGVLLARVERERDAHLAMPSITSGTRGLGDLAKHVGAPQARLKNAKHWRLNAFLTLIRKVWRAAGDTGRLTGGGDGSWKGLATDYRAMLGRVVDASAACMHVCMYLHLAVEIRASCGCRALAPRWLGHGVQGSRTGIDAKKA